MLLKHTKNSKGGWKVLTLIGGRGEGERGWMNRNGGSGYMTCQYHRKNKHWDEWLINFWINKRGGIFHVDSEYHLLKTMTLVFFSSSKNTSTKAWNSKDYKWLGREENGFIFFLAKFIHALKTQCWHPRLFHGKDSSFFSLTLNYKAEK